MKRQRLVGLISPTFVFTRILRKAFFGEFYLSNGERDLAKDNQSLLSFWWNWMAFFVRHVNVTNILQAAFCTKVFYVLQFDFAILWQTEIGKKAPHKMFVKLTPRWNYVDTLLLQLVAHMLQFHRKRPKFKMKIVLGNCFSFVRSKWR